MSDLLSGLSLFFYIFNLWGRPKCHFLCPNFAKVKVLKFIIIFFLLFFSELLPIFLIVFLLKTFLKSHTPVINTHYRDDLISILVSLNIDPAAHRFHAFRRTGVTLAFFVKSLYKTLWLVASERVLLYGFTFKMHIQGHLSFLLLSPPLSPLPYDWVLPGKLYNFILFYLIYFLYN